MRRLGHPAKPAYVSLCEEGVDWNLQVYDNSRKGVVSLCEEGVDWNIRSKWPITHKSSLPLRGGSGLKSCLLRRIKNMNIVSLCEEGVDWNSTLIESVLPVVSPSARREWIEIMMQKNKKGDAAVSLCEEGVDWNLNVHEAFLVCSCLPLRGGSGLKYTVTSAIPAPTHRLPLRGGSGLKFSY